MSKQLNPHKFKGKSNPGEPYSLTVFCEYCGMIAFNANYSQQTREFVETKIKDNVGCHLSPFMEEISIKENYKL